MLMVVLMLQALIVWLFAYLAEGFVTFCQCKIMEIFLKLGEFLGAAEQILLNKKDCFGFVFSL